MTGRERDSCMRVLITGAGGFIGRNLITALLGEADTEVVALSRSGLDIPGVRVYPCDILNRGAVESVFRENQFDCVIHLAAITAHSEIVDNRMKTFETNLQGTINLLNSFNTYCRGGQFIYASTGKVYGKTNEMPISENALVNPTNILGKTKRITEEVIEFYAQPENRYLILRIFNIYGEGQRSHFVLPTILAQLEQEHIQLGSLKDFRDYLYVDDLIDAFKACIASPAKFSNVDHVNIGSGEPACVADILREIEKLIGRKLKVTVDQSKFRHDETPVEFCNHSKLTAQTGWTPRYSLADGVEKTLRANGVIS